MHRVVVWYHKNGEDSLAVVDVPLWNTAVEYIIVKLLHPWMPWNRFEKSSFITYRIFGKLLSFLDKYEKELISIPVEDGLIVSQALWPDAPTIDLDEK